MTPRDQAYLDMLHFGLHRIRENAALGYIEYCTIESEHLHNVPSLIGETNEKRHEYYFRQERDTYLQRVDRTLPGVSFTLERYTELWPVINQIKSESQRVVKQNMKLSGPFQIQVASDVQRDGLGVELLVGNDVVAEVFRCDADHTLIATTFGNDLPLATLERFISSARERLREFEDGTPLPETEEK
ncbi:MAG: hypothetical protein ACAH89_03700 [Rariglobus sp.]